VAGEKEAVDNSAFDRVVRYFLGHGKPKDEPAAKPKRPGKPRKKPSAKPKKRA